jgi:hypothetical protein
MPGCAMPCKAANTCRLWQAGTSGLAFPVEMSHHMDVPATRWFTTWREDDRLAACVSPQHGWAAAIAEKLFSAAQAGGKAVQPGQGLLQLLSGPAVWVLAGPVVRQLSGLVVWVQAGLAGRQLSGPAVWAPTGPAVRGAARGLDMVSATTFSLPGMCLMSLVYSAM